MAEIQHFLPQQPGHPAGVSDWPACSSLSIAQSGPPFPSVQGAEMFWSPLRTAALRTGPALHCIPLGGHKEEEAPQAAARSRGTVAALPACCPRLPWDLLYGFLESSACRRPQSVPPPSVQEASSVNLSCQHTSLAAPAATPIHTAAQPQQTRGHREHITQCSLQNPWSRAFASPSCTCSGFHSWRYSWLNKMLSPSRESL